MTTRDCNTCAHHKQGEHPPLFCRICLSSPTKLVHWSPMKRNDSPLYHPLRQEQQAKQFKQMEQEPPAKKFPCEVAFDGKHHYENGACIDCKEPQPQESTKLTNPKDLVGSNKLPMHLWPETATAMGALGLLDGMLKYGRSNWREAGVRASIYADAARRHLAAWFEGEDADPDSGLSHLSHALACLAILVDAQFAGKLTDDRMYPGGYRKAITEMTPHVNRLKALHADKAPKHYTIGDVK